VHSTLVADAIVRSELSVIAINPDDDLALWRVQFLPFAGSKQSTREEVL
jgi:hypothetical protein